MRTLDEVRKDIDKVDEVIIDAILKRIGLSHEVKCIKEGSKKEVYDPQREKEIIAVLQERVEPIHHNYIEDLYKMIFDYSRALQRK